jgi:hypothetical protein
VLPPDDGPLFTYGESELCTILVHPVVYAKDVPLEARELECPAEEHLLPPKRHKIHRGYLRVLKGFLREIDLMYKDGIKEHNCLFRATYLLKILDHFVEELPRVVPGAESRWRSRSLNPLLQRQLQRILDQEPRMVEIQVGTTPDGAARFYLMRDPLDPALIPEVIRGILYVWPVRWSLGSLHSSCSTKHYDCVRANATSLLRTGTDVDDQKDARGKLTKNEKAVIAAENLWEVFNLTNEHPDVSPIYKPSQLSDKPNSQPPLSRATSVDLGWIPHHPLFLSLFTQTVESSEPPEEIPMGDIVHLSLLD